MHSRIFQVSLKPIAVEDYIPVFDMQDMMPDYMDYITDDNDKAEDIDWLKNFLSEFSIDNDKIIITKEALKDKIEEKLDKIRELIDNCSFDTWSMDTYRIKSQLDDKFGFHIYDDDAGYIETLDSWLNRQIWKFEDKDVKEIVFYFGGTFDYHS